MVMFHSFLYVYQRVYAGTLEIPAPLAVLICSCTLTFDKSKSFAKTDQVWSKSPPSQRKKDEKSAAFLGLDHLTWWFHHIWSIGPSFKKWCWPMNMWIFIPKDYSKWCHALFWRQKPCRHITARLAQKFKLKSDSSQVSSRESAGQAFVQRKWCHALKGSCPSEGTPVIFRVETGPSMPMRTRCPACIQENGGNQRLRKWFWSSRFLSRTFKGEQMDENSQ